MEIGKYINYTNLKMDATEKDINKQCQEAINNGFETVCVHPYYVALAKELLESSNIGICTVIGFPLGMNTPKTKTFEAVEALELGADEIEMVINIGALKDKDYNYVKKEIEEIRDILEGKTLKIIIDASLLTDNEIIKITEICNETFVNFIKVSVDNQKNIIELINKHKNDILEIEAFGHIHTYKQMNELIEKGVTRIGTHNAVDIIESMEE